MQRIERYFIPEAALREALLNALCHSNHSLGIPVQISVYEDRLYIANSGCLPENWTIDNLMTKHASKPFNPNIAHVFYLAGFIKSWGRGIEKICTACQEDVLPQPEYTINPGDIMIKFMAPEDRIVGSTTSKVAEKVVEKISVVELQILSLLREDPAYTYAALAEKTHLSKKTIFIKIKALKEKGILERVGGSSDHVRKKRIMKHEFLDKRSLQQKPAICD